MSNKKEPSNARRTVDDARLATAMRHAADGVTIIEPARGDGFEIVYANAAFEKMSGFDADDLVGRDWQSLLGGESDSGTVEKIIWALRAREALATEILSHRADGSPFWTEINLTPVFDSTGALDFYLLTHADVTDRVRVRLTLEEHTAMLADAEQIAHLGHWAWDIWTGRLWWSEEIYRIHGLDPTSTQPTLESSLAAYHPDDRAGVRRTIQEAAEARSAFTYEVRIVRPGGEIRWVHIEGRHITRLSGNKCLFGTTQDITRQREVEDALRRREEKYRRLMETVPLGVQEIDSSGRILYANAAHSHDLGYERGATPGPSIFDLIPGELQRGQALRQFKEVLKGKPAQFVTACRTVDGEILDVEVNAAATRDAHGRVDSIIAVTRDITERLTYEKRLRQLAYYDKLTGLGNRGLFQEYVKASVETIAANQRVAVGLINVDNFKIINEVLGPSAGDHVIASLARSLQQTVANGEHIARIGGDELGVLIAGNPDRPTLVRRLRDLKESLEKPLRWQGRRIDINLSVGAAVWPHDARDGEQLVQAADTALRDVKRHEPGGIRFYGAEMKTAAEAFMQLRGRLRDARERDQFFIEYQPQVDLDINRIVGLEALVRWRDSEGEIIPPSRFIPVAEETGDIVPLGWWIFETVCHQIRAWQSAGLKVPPISVNLSARQVLNEDLAPTLGRILQTTGVDASDIQLELTETAMMVDSYATLRRMREIDDLGIGIALDDFGTGYSSLSHLSQFPIESLKIDRSFIVDMTRTTKQAALVSAVIALGNRLGLDVVAEGVETARQVQFLKSHHCDAAQGFYFSQAVSAARAGAMLETGIVPPVAVRSI